MIRREDRIEIVGEAGAEERDLPLPIPFVQKAGEHPDEVSGVAEGHDAQRAASEVRPPGDQPFGGLERSGRRKATQKLRPLRMEIGELCGIPEDLEAEHTSRLRFASEKTRTHG